MGGIPRKDRLAAVPTNMPVAQLPARSIRSEKQVEGTIGVHAAQHRSGGGDALTAGDVGASASGHSHVGADNEVTVKLPTDVSTSGQAFVDATGLSFSAEADSDYIVEFWIWYTTAATTTGIDLAVNGPASPTAVVGLTLPPVAATGNLNAKQFNAYDVSQPATASIAGNNFALMRVLFRNGATAGTFTLRFASEVNASAVTVKAGSVLRYRKVT